MGFCTVINCIDGRTQLPVIRYLQQRFDVDHVDSITEPGPNLILCEQKKSPTIQSILERARISIEHHSSVGVAVAGHHGCAGNPASREEQMVHIQKSIEFLTRELEGMEIVGLWVDEEWQVHEVPAL
ncbi:MAG: carbonic anhydrase [Planctomycetota bacterium]